MRMIINLNMCYLSLIFHMWSSMTDFKRYILFRLKINTLLYKTLLTWLNMVIYPFIAVGNLRHFILWSFAAIDWQSDVDKVLVSFLIKFATFIQKIIIILYILFLNAVYFFKCRLRKNKLWKHIFNTGS